MLRLHANIRPWVQLTRAYVCARLVENAHPTRSKDARLRRSGAKRTPWLSVDAFHGTSYRALEGTFSAAALHWPPAEPWPPARGKPAADGDTSVRKLG